jgi:hypothetical protein
MSNFGRIFKRKNVNNWLGGMNKDIGNSDPKKINVIGAIIEEARNIAASN